MSGKDGKGGKGGSRTGKEYPPSYLGSPWAKDPKGGGSGKGSGGKGGKGK
jgi:hypothetical protein